MTLTYVSDDEGGEGTVSRRLTFRRVVAFTFHNEAHARDWPQEAYEAIAERDDSDWLKTLRASVPDGQTTWPFKRRHFVVYLRNHGCYEVVAEELTEDSVSDHVERP